MKAFRTSIFVLLGLAIFLISFRVIWGWQDAKFKHAITDSDLLYFNVLVISKGTIHKLFYEELDTFCKENPDYTFLIPLDKVEYFNDQLRREHDNVNASWRLTVTPKADGKQAIQISAYGDGEFSCWYETSDKKITPQFIKHYGAGFAFIVLEWLCPITAIAWVILFYVWKRYEKRLAALKATQA